MSALSDRTESSRADDSTGRPRRDLVTPAALFGVLLLLYAVTIAHSIVSLDVWSANFGSWHLVRTGHPWIEGLRIPVLDRSPFRPEWVVQAHGHSVIGRAPGVIAAALPAYAALGGSSFSIVPGGLSAALLTATAVTLMYLALRSRLSRRDALLAAAAFGLATPVWSVAANGMWPHTVTVLGISGMAWAASRERWWWAGAFGGVTLWGRLHAAVIVAVLGCLVGLGRRRPGIVVRIGLASGAFLVGMSLWTRWMYGSWNPTASYDTSPFADYASSHRIDLVNQLGFWVAPDRGILVWTPVTLLLLPALARAWRELPDWSRSLLWGGLAYTVLQGVLNRFSGGDVFYGYRLELELLACATPALAFAAPRMGKVCRALVGPVLALQLLAIAWGSVRDTAYLPSTQAWHRNAFAVAVQHAGVAGWLSVGLALGIGLLLQRMWAERRPGAESAATRT
jgi:alpha-1,2-mannosyltransferase